MPTPCRGAKLVQGHGRTLTSSCSDLRALRAGIVVCFRDDFELLAVAYGVESLCDRSATDNGQGTQHRAPQTIRDLAAGWRRAARRARRRRHRGAHSPRRRRVDGRWRDRGCARRARLEATCTAHPLGPLGPAWRSGRQQPVHHAASARRRESNAWPPRAGWIWPARRCLTGTLTSPLLGVAPRISRMGAAPIVSTRTASSMGMWQIRAKDRSRSASPATKYRPSGTQAAQALMPGVFLNESEH